MEPEVEVVSGRVVLQGIECGPASVAWQGAALKRKIVAGMDLGPEVAPLLHSAGIRTHLPQTCLGNVLVTWLRTEARPEATVMTGQQHGD